MDPVNLKKLAEQLSLSVSTVSKAFHNSYDINKQTKDRILALARELNYQPNPLASSLRTQKSRTIAVILPEIANSFFTLAINGIESVAQELGYHVLIYLTHEDHLKEVAFTHHLQSGRVDGVIMSLSDGTKGCTHLDNLRQKGLPVVFFDRIYEKCATAKVTTNDYESGYQATQHLIEQGCKKIAHLRFAQDLSISKKRMEGYIQALKDNDLPFHKKMVIFCNNTEEDYILIKEALSSLKPDGIFSSFEKLAMHTYQASAALNIRIPENLKVISFSNLETAPLLHPSLTTITQPAFEIGKRAASVLFRALEDGTVTIPDEHITINSVLMKRASTANY
ncbi:MAG TPA: LacI family DNA-binding transcriptional regulator [Flavisolibacter sp.]|nr:LacI family DNA-binding transcriptional regulator [Flavisolibacter sp.]